MPKSLTLARHRHRRSVTCDSRSARGDIVVRRWKTLGIAVLLLGAGSAAPLAAQQAVFATATLRAHEPPADAYWDIRDPNFPYPGELAKDSVTGCLVAEMKVTRSGKSKDIRVLYAFPADVERAFKRPLNRIRWVPIDDSGEAREEVRKVQVDFCASWASQEEARAVCEIAARQSCD